MIYIYILGLTNLDLRFRVNEWRFENDILNFKK